MAHNRPPLIDLTPSSNIQRLPVTADKSSSLKRKADEPASIEFGYDSDGAEDEFGYDMTMDKSANQGEETNNGRVFLHPTNTRQSEE